MVFVSRWTNRQDWLTAVHPAVHLCKLGFAAKSVCEGHTLLFRAILSETQTVGPLCDDEEEVSEAVPAQRSCQCPGGMVTDWSPSPPLFLTRVHFSGDRSKCRLQCCNRLFSSLNTVGTQKVTGWFSPKLRFLGVWQQMHYCVLAGCLDRLMYATRTHSMAFCSVTLKVAAAGWGHEPGWINCFEPDLSLPVFFICISYLIYQKVKLGTMYTLTPGCYFAEFRRMSEVLKACL